MTDRYILEGKTPVPCEDIMEWAMKFETTDRRVAFHSIGDVKISTVFLGVDHRFMGHGDPLLFETMIFGGEYDGYCERYATWDQAEAGHSRALTLIGGLR